MPSSVRYPFKTPLKQQARFGRHTTLNAFIDDLRIRLATAQKTAAAFRKKADETPNSSLQIYFANTAATYQVIAESHESAIERLLQEQASQTPSNEP